MSIDSILINISVHNSKLICWKRFPIQQILLIVEKIALILMYPNTWYGIQE